METDFRDTRLHGPGDDRLISIGEAALMVGMGRSKLYELCSDQQFPNPVKIGRATRFSRTEVQRWIEAKLARRTGAGAGK